MKVSVVLAFLLLAFGVSWASEAPVSDETRSCLGCHEGLHPGIVGDWKTSRHSRVAPAEAMGKPALERRVSADAIDKKLMGVSVGCYECHGLNPDRHKDNFGHYGFNINVVVSPNDCSTCHPVEAKEYSGSKKAYAWRNIEKNPVYHTLFDSIIGLKEVEGMEITGKPASAYTRQDACFACHGTVVEVKGMKTVETGFGKVQVPDLTGWPNQGLGRINPDGTRGACTSCHARHAFSIEVARQPFTCGQCHREPDVPAYEIYTVSKHGNIFNSRKAGWDFDAVPWKLGEDFTAPTCAACHVSLVTKPDGAVLAERSHDFGSRLWVRLFGLIYTHPQPKKGDTTIIKNADGLPLPTTFTGERASEYLLDAKAQAARMAKMTSVCRGCHSTSWVNAHFQKMDNTIEETDRMTLAATKLLTKAWEAGVADNSNPFDEAIERKWVKQWLFYGNAARYASAMTGAQDYVAFKYGWWGLTTNLQEMKDKIETKIKLKENGDK
jgi:hypothetical protein